jgi:DNA (cytosine-5)-methyltransferase 1
VARPLGIELALGRSPDIAINHDAEAIAMHQVNHPDTQHFCEDVWAVDPVKATQGPEGRPDVALAGLQALQQGQGRQAGREEDPRARVDRGPLGEGARQEQAARHRLENVEEFADWGPLGPDNQPDRMKKGLTFRRFVKQLQNLGYEVDWQELVAATTARRRPASASSSIARCDGEPIVWPEPTHGKGLIPWRTAAECIDWSLRARRSSSASARWPRTR